MNIPLCLPLSKVDGREWIELIDSEGKSVADVTTFDRPDQKAEYILRAVNSHNELVTALRIIANQSIGDDWTPEQAITFIKQHARTAIAKAEPLAEHQDVGVHANYFSFAEDRAVEYGPFNTQQDAWLSFKGSMTNYQALERQKKEGVKFYKHPIFKLEDA